MCLIFDWGDDASEQLALVKAEVFRSIHPLEVSLAVSPIKPHNSTEYRK